MRIVGNTVGTTMPRPDLRQNDPRKGDFVKGKPDKIAAIEDLAEAGLVEPVADENNAVFVDESNNILTL